LVSLNELKRFFQVLSIRKILNFFLCYFSYYLSLFLKKPFVLHRPFTLSFEPTTKCNLSCPECPSGLKSFTRPRGNALLQDYETVLEKVKDHLIFIYLYFQGEPFIHKDFAEMIRLAKKHHLYTITSTNAHYLTPAKCEETISSGLDRILISIDGSTQEVYEQYRKDGTLSKVIEGTKNLVAAKKRLKKTNPEIIFQMLVVKPNEHQIEEIYQLANELGVDKVVLKTAQIYDFENGSDLIPTIDKYARYRITKSGKWVIKNELKNQCWKLWHSAVSTWDGHLIPCCFDKDAQYKMGNLLEQDLDTIWNNEVYTNFRTSILKSRKEIDICKNCSEGTKVWETV
jgi:radical SAM protein with 4Fe4S-binding SPASM domain